jgi:hypothetical protein
VLPLVPGWATLGRQPPRRLRAGKANGTGRGNDGQGLQSPRAANYGGNRQDTVLFLSAPKEQKLRFQGRGPLRYAPWSVPPKNPKELAVTCLVDRVACGRRQSATYPMVGGSAKRNAQAGCDRSRLKS